MLRPSAHSVWREHHAQPAQQLQKRLYQRIGNGWSTALQLQLLIIVCLAPQGVRVGEHWKDRLDCRQWGAHFPHVAGIAGQSGQGAQSVVLSGGCITASAVECCMMHRICMICCQ